MDGWTALKPEGSSLIDKLLTMIHTPEGFRIRTFSEYISQCIGSFAPLTATRYS